MEHPRAPTRKFAAASVLVVGKARTSWVDRARKRLCAKGPIGMADYVTLPAPTISADGEPQAERQEQLQNDRVAACHASLQGDGRQVHVLGKTRCKPCHTCFEICHPSEEAVREEEVKCVRVASSPNERSPNSNKSRCFRCIAFTCCWFLISSNHVNDSRK